MPTFAYRAADRQGQTIDGVMEAPDARGVVERLQRDAYFPIHVKPQDERQSTFGLTLPTLGRRRITRVEVLTLVQQLATLIKSRKEAGSRRGCTSFVIRAGIGASSTSS